MNYYQLFTIFGRFKYMSKGCRVEISFFPCIYRVKQTLEPPKELDLYINLTLNPAQYNSLHIRYKQKFHKIEFITLYVYNSWIQQSLLNRSTLGPKLLGIISSQAYKVKNVQLRYNQLRVQYLAEHIIYGLIVRQLLH